MLGNLIGGFVVILVGVTIAPTVMREFNEAMGNETNVTGLSSTVADLLPLFFILGVASAGIAIAATGLRAAKLLGEDEEDSEDEEEQEEKTNLQFGEVKWIDEEKTKDTIYKPIFEQKTKPKVKKQKVKYPFHKDGVCELTGKTIDSDEECEVCKNNGMV